MADSNPIEVLRDFFDLNKMVRGSSEREDKCVAALDELATALEAAREDAWQPIETAPKDGNCLLAIETDDGYTFAVLERDKKGNWIHEGEPTYRHGYYFNPTHWRPLPAPPAIDAARKEVGDE